MEGLPNQLKHKFIAHVYEERYSHLRFFIGKSMRFITWISPQLVPEWYDEQEYFFKDGDQVDRFYFLVAGEAQFVLPEFYNLPYINISNNNHFGLIDIVGCSQEHKFAIHNWYDNYYKLKRHFSIRTSLSSEVLYLDIDKIKSMGDKYPKDFDTIFGQIGQRYKRSMAHKLKVYDQARAALSNQTNEAERRELIQLSQFEILNIDDLDPPVKPEDF